MTTTSTTQSLGQFAPGTVGEMLQNSAPGTLSVTVPNPNSSPIPSPLGGVSIAPTTSPTVTYSNTATPSPTLASTPVTSTPTAHAVSSASPLTVPTTPIDTSSSKVAGYSTGIMSQYQQTQNTNDAMTALNYSNQQNQNTNSNTNSTDLTNRIAQQFGVDPQALLAQYATKGQVTSDLNTQYQVPEKIQAAQDAYNQYQSASLALNQQIEQIRTTPGLTQEQANQQIQEVSKSGNANLANLAVINQAAQGNMSTAMNIVQMKLDQQFKPIQDQIDNIGKFVQINNADLTDSQKTQLENQRFVMQNNLNNLMSAKQSAHQFALQQGIQDPNVLNAIDNAQTPADVYAAVGGNANGLPQSSSQNTSVSPQYANYQSQTINGTNYVSQDKLTNLTPYQQQDAARQYAAAGVPVLTSGQTVVVQNIDTTRQNLSDLNNVTSKILGSGAVGRIGSSIANFIGGTLQTNPDVAAFNNYRQLAIGALKSLGAGTGGSRITTGEIQTAQDNLPTIYDSLETAQKKSAILTSQLDKWQNELLPGSVNGQSNTSSSGGLYNF